MGQVVHKDFHYRAHDLCEAEQLQQAERETIEPWKAKLAWAAIALFCGGTFMCVVTMVVVPLARFMWDWAH